MPAGDGPLGQFLSALPVTPRQIWLAVVITTGISYLGYVLQTYLFPRKGLLLAGLVGGLYSSTVTVRGGREEVEGDAGDRRTGGDRHPACRVDDVPAAADPGRDLPPPVGVPRRAGARRAVVPRGRLRAVAAAGGGPAPAAASMGGGEATPAADVAAASALRRNPLELNAALLFAVLFAVVSFATKYVLAYFSDLGLRMLSFVVGFSDITPVRRLAAPGRPRASPTGRSCRRSSSRAPATTC